MTSQVTTAVLKIKNKRLNLMPTWHVAFARHQFSASELHRLLNTDYKHLEDLFSYPFISLLTNSSNFQIPLNIVSNPNNGFLADPFLYQYRKKNFLFVEEYVGPMRKGVISCYWLDESSIHKIGIAIEEPFHLSFPYIFNYNNKIYMCPESLQNGDIRIYECIDFPVNWKYLYSPIKNVDAVDTVLFYNSPYWWLLTCMDSCRNKTCDSDLFAFYAQSPISDMWLPHHSNPIIRKAEKARNAGLVSFFQDTYRISQAPSFNTYGYSFSVNKILSIDPISYKENTLFTQLPFIKKSLGTHHLSISDNYISFDFLI